ncbi:MAG: hypothetical protein NTX50_19890 [Candidatus Sumerlaeota bacterium]|nr:hypothetical protein [Candidatus Sumerlaeota bacterium]
MIFNDEPDDIISERERQIAAYLDGEMAANERRTFEARIHSDAALRLEVEQWREALVAARDWAQADAPGVERAAALPIPSYVASRATQDAPHGDGDAAHDAKYASAPGLKYDPARDPKHDPYHAPKRERTRVSNFRPSLIVLFRNAAWAALAAAAIFVAGFALGRTTQRGVAPQPTHNETIAQAPHPPIAAPTTPGSYQAAPPSAPAIPATNQQANATTSPSESQTANAGHDEMAGVPFQQYSGEDGRLVIETKLKTSGARAVWIVDGKFQVAQRM